jgi:hypothetical protein
MHIQPEYPASKLNIFWLSKRLNKPLSLSKISRGRTARLKWEFPTLSTASGETPFQGTPVRDRGGPYGTETSRLPHFLDNRITDGGEVVSLAPFKTITKCGAGIVRSLNTVSLYFTRFYFILHWFISSSFLISSSSTWFSLPQPVLTAFCSYILHWLYKIHSRTEKWMSYVFM